MSHRPEDPNSFPPVPIPVPASLGSDKGSRVLMWISGVGLAMMLIAVISLLWEERPVHKNPEQPPGDQSLSQPSR